MAAAAGRLGRLVESQAGRLLVGSTLALLLLCAAIKSARLDAEPTSWLHLTGRVQSELHYLDGQLAPPAPNGGPGEPTPRTADAWTGPGQLLLQEPRDQRQQALTVEALMVHLEAVAIATQTSVDLHGVTWGLKDICLAPTVPDFGEGFNVAQLLDKMMPCAIKTPLDCFWEGAKLLPDQPVRLRDSLPPFKWASANPELMIRAMQHNYPHANFPYADILAWMGRLGVGAGYQHKPCLDPLDANCPETAPNKRHTQAPDIGASLTGGCRGVAANQMHWREDELVGGLERNLTGHIKRAHALQTSIQLMGERDMFEYWRKTVKVQDISNWSSEKAKLVLDTWQRQFRDELARFASTSKSARPFKLHVMSVSAQLEPIDLNSLLDLGPFELTLGALTVFACLSVPSLADLVKARSCLLALVTSSYIGLTFIASLGLASLINLPLNMLTTHLLPTLAFCYSFRHLTIIANIYSQQLDQNPSHLTVSCFKKLLPIIRIETIISLCPLLIAAIVPVPVTRVFALQAICYISLATYLATILIPSLFAVFLLHHASELKDSDEIFTITGNRRKDSHSRKAKISQEDDIMLEEQLFSRIQDDLKNIQADIRVPGDINFSAQLEADGVRTSFRLTTSRSTGARNNNYQLNANLTTIDRQRQQPPPPAYDEKFDANVLPDLLADAQPKLDENRILPLIVENELAQDKKETDVEKESTSTDRMLFKFYSSSITGNKFVQALLCIISLGTLVTLVSQSLKVNYGLKLSDIVTRDGTKYESYTIQEKYFPIYNIFAITKGNFDYATNQKLLHEYYRALGQADGVIEDDGAGRFWLIRFRNWLLELQQQFDSDRNLSLIDKEGWKAEASNAAKLAYKLLAQTGKPDNPVNKSLVETNRLVDEAGIVNPKAFYYYLFAWVVNDPYTYATSEACFKPEYRADKWRDDPEILKIDKPQPITFAQIPFLMKLPLGEDSLDKVSRLRAISDTFERHNLPNFLTGIPFIFWDQFVHLKIILSLLIGAIIMISFICIGFSTDNFNIAAITVLSILITLLELYGLMGCLSIPFNNIIAILLISSIGLISAQTFLLSVSFEAKEGSLKARTNQTLHGQAKTIIKCLLVLMISSLALQSSKINFIVEYSYLLIGVTILNSFNLLLVMPAILSRIGFSHRRVEERQQEVSEHKQEKLVRKQIKRKPVLNKTRVHKKRRKYPIAKSEISLSTISEEPQTEAPFHDLKLDFSVRCY